MLGGHGVLQVPPSLSVGGFLLHTTWVSTVDTRSGHNHWFLGLRSGQNHLGSAMAGATDCGVVKTTGLDCVVVQTASFTHVASHVELGLVSHVELGSASHVE